MDFSPIKALYAYDFSIMKTEDFVYDESRGMLYIEYFLSEEEILYERAVETLSTTISLTGGLIGFI